MLQLRGQTAFAADNRQVCLVRSSGKSAACVRVIRPSRRGCTISCQASSAPPVYKGDLLNGTYYPTEADTSNVNKSWYIIDAKGQRLGRLATLAATYIRGKHQPTYSPSMDMGAYVIVINAEKVELSGVKETQKTYFRHVNGRPGSTKVEPFLKLRQRLPERIIEHAVQGMLPKGRLGRDIKLHLKAYRSTAHPHEAQLPIDITSEISVKPKNSAGAKLLAQKKAEMKK